jgi:hypothetical protein
MSDKVRARTCKRTKGVMRTWRGLCEGPLVKSCLPKQGPRLPQAVAQKNVSVANGAVFDPKTVADVTGNLTRLEHPLDEFARYICNEDRLWRRISISAKRMKVHPADCLRRPQRRAVQIDCASLARIPCQDA